METVKLLAGGVVLIGVIAAIGVHSSGLTKFSGTTLRSTGGVFHTVEQG